MIAAQSIAKKTRINSKNCFYFCLIWLFILKLSTIELESLQIFKKYLNILDFFLLLRPVD